MSATKTIFNEIKSGEITPEEAVSRFETEAGARIYRRKSRSDRRKQYQESSELRERILSKPVPFITPYFLDNFFLTQGLVLVGGKPGRAKTTTGANIIAGFLKHCPGRHAIVISNEEAADALYERVACILLEYSYQELFNGKMIPQKRERVKDKVDEIIEYLEVVTDGDHWDPSYIEDVQAVLETAAREGIGMVLVDYLQTITQSRVNPDMESFAVSKALGFYFKDFGKRHGVPVVVLAQLRDTDGAEFADRIQNDKTIFNHAFIAIEVKPDFETVTTEFIITKDRFCGTTGRRITMDFKGGTYVSQI